MGENSSSSIEFACQTDTLHRGDHLLNRSGASNAIQGSQKHQLISDRDISGKDRILRHHRNPAHQTWMPGRRRSEHLDRALLHSQESCDQ